MHFFFCSFLCFFTFDFPFVSSAVCLSQYVLKLIYVQIAVS